jgi:hypothetical protein
MSFGRRLFNPAKQPDTIVAITNSSHGPPRQV